MLNVPFGLTHRLCVVAVLMYVCLCLFVVEVMSKLVVEGLNRFPESFSRILLKHVAYYLSEEAIPDIRRSNSRSDPTPFQASGIDQPTSFHAIPGSWLESAVLYKLYDCDQSPVVLSSSVKHDANLLLD